MVLEISIMVTFRYSLVTETDHSKDFLGASNIMSFKMGLILGGLGMQWLEVGLGFPARDLGHVVAMKAPNPSH